MASNLELNNLLFSDALKILACYGDRTMGIVYTASPAWIEDIGYIYFSAAHDLTTKIGSMYSIAGALTCLGANMDDPRWSVKPIRELNNGQ